jgi:outer membrane protein
VQRVHAAAASGAARIDAYREAVAASRTALDGVTRARDAGMATNADVLDAQTRLYSALRDATQARYEYLAARMRLLIAAGLPMQQVVDEINALLTQRTEWTSSAMLTTGR